MDDDCGGSDTFEGLLAFLSNHYFPRLKWAALILNPLKSKFFIDTVKMLGHVRQAGWGICLSADKIAVLAHAVK